MAHKELTWAMGRRGHKLTVEHLTHTEHQGARQCVYWPGITADVTRAIKHCEECQVLQASQPREPLLQDKPATRPGEAIAADFFNQDGKDDFAVADNANPTVAAFFSQP